MPADPLPARPVPGLRAVVFDLDGVLVDSFAVMREAFAAAYREVVGEGDPPFREYCAHLGRYFPEIMRIMGLPPDMEAPFVRESYRLQSRVRVYDGVPAMLHRLRDLGIRTAVATGKSGARARSLLGDLGLLPLFGAVIGSDEVPRPKPAPDIVRRALRELAVPPGAAVMVGDAVSDLRSARAAGVASAAAVWGEGDEAGLRAAAPDFVVREPAEIARLAEDQGERAGDSNSGSPEIPRTG
ncbi:HAD-IA family hydrolase [Saccharopolyspora rosea]|uniref:HAD-IA family hydrolase n=1 Tax=Saccharopolyspora rosea TaxID=524884 RepID=UPI0021DA4F50|nr:HAD-IA family hydrolase [Saccharopolyspora rosea]